jgi:hypothetical protein
MFQDIPPGCSAAPGRLPGVGNAGLFSDVPAGQIRDVVHNANSRADEAYIFDCRACFAEHNAVMGLAPEDQTKVAIRGALAGLLTFLRDNDIRNVAMTLLST